MTMDSKEVKETLLQAHNIYLLLQVYSCPLFNAHTPQEMTVDTLLFSHFIINSIINVRS